MSKSNFLPFARVMLSGLKKHKQKNIKIIILNSAELRVAIKYFHSLSIVSSDGLNKDARGQNSQSNISPLFTSNCAH